VSEIDVFISLESRECDSPSSGCPRVDLPRQPDADRRTRLLGARFARSIPRLASLHAFALDQKHLSVRRHTPAITMLAETRASLCGDSVAIESITAATTPGEFLNNRE